MANATKFLVIGAGVSGLCAAHLIAQRHGIANLLLLEASSHAGGTARTDHARGFQCEWGPNGFLSKEPRTLAWVDDLGLTPRLVRANEAAAHRFVLRRGQLHEVKPPPGFLRSPLLSVRGRARLLCEPLIPAKKDETPETVYDFAARRIGREAADTLVSPMVTGIFGGDARQLSLVDCFPRMAEMERTHGSLFKALKSARRANPGASPMGPSGVLTTFDGGLQTLVDAAVRRLGTYFRPNSRVTSLRRAGAGFVARTEDGDTIEAEKVVVATPAFTAADFVHDLDQHAASALGAIPYAGIAVVCVGYPMKAVGHGLNGFGFLVPRTERLRLLGCIWTSSLFPNQSPPDWAFLRLMFGGASDPAAVSLSDEELLELVERELHPLLRISSPPEFVRIIRHSRGIPQYHLGHALRLKAIEAAEEHFPGLAFAGNAYRGVGINDCVASAHRAIGRAGIDADCG